jgi:hypothetical protein
VTLSRRVTVAGAVGGVAGTIAMSALMLPAGWLGRQGTEEVRVELMVAAPHP